LTRPIRPSHVLPEGAKTDPENEIPDLARVRRLRGYLDSPQPPKALLRVYNGQAMPTRMHHSQEETEETLCYLLETRDKLVFPSLLVYGHGKKISD